MAHFCGELENATKVTQEGVLANECFVDGLVFIPNLVFLVISLTILIAWNKSHYGSISAKSWVHFPAHAPRWFLTSFLAIVNVTEIVEGILSDTLYRGNHLHLYIPAFVALIGTITSITYYHHVEKWNSPRFLLLLVLYWTFLLGTKVLKLLHITWDNVGTGTMLYGLVCTVVTIYALLIIVELYVWIKLRYAVFPSPVKLRPPEELVNTGHTYNYVNLLSKATFIWALKLLTKGYKHVLELKHLGTLPPADWTFTHYQTLRKVVEDAKKQATVKAGTLQLWRCYFCAFWPMILVTGTFKLAGDLLGFIAPFCIGYILEFVEDSFPVDSDNVRSNVTVSSVLPGSRQYMDVLGFFTNGYVVALVMLLAIFLQNTFLQTHYYLVTRLGMRLRSAVQGVVYEKVLKLSPWILTHGTLTQGQVTSHMTIDPFNTMMFFFMCHQIWALPLKFVITIGLLYLKLGWPCLVGGAIVLVIIPVQYKVSQIYSDIQKQTVESSENRLNKCSELLTSIKLLKLYAWEKLFCIKVQKAREQHLKLLTKGACIAAVLKFITMATPVLVTVLSLGIYARVEEAHPLTASQAFTCLALFDILSMAHLCPLITNIFINAKVSTARLVPLLLLPEVDRTKPDIITTSSSTLGSLSQQRTPTDERKPVDFYLKPPGGVENGDSGDESQENSRDLLQTIPEEDAGNKKIRKRERNSASTSEADDRPQKAFLSENKNTRPKSMGSLTGNTEEIEMKPLADGKRKRPKSGSGVIRQASTTSLCTDEELGYIDPQRDVGLAVVVKMGNFSWNPHAEQPDLKDINFNADAGKLTYLTGPVGSGKSMLLNAILGEMTKLSGTLAWKKGMTVAYVSQKPWILNATIQENILFGQSIEVKRYRRVLHACALNPDLAILPGGDQTEIGEQGINLSNGQKVRINLARAFYSKADVVIMDDALSTLDPHVVAQIFEEGMLKFMFRRKRTVILATHQVQYVPFAHKVVCMRNGVIEHQGTLEELKVAIPETYAKWEKAVRAARHESTKSSEDEENATNTERWQLRHQVCTHEFQRQHSQTQFLVIPSMEVQMSLDDEFVSASPRQAFFTRQTSQFSFSDDISADAPVYDQALSHGSTSLKSHREYSLDLDDSPDMEEVHKLREQGKLICSEDAETGVVPAGIYWAYIRACSVGLFCLVVALHVVRTVVGVATDGWLAVWTKAHRIHNTTTAFHEFDLGFYAHSYLSLGGITIVMSLVVALAAELIGIHAAARLHRTMLRAVVHAPMRFFDTTPISKIFGRFSGDVFIIDDRLPASIEGLFRTVLLCVAALLVNVVASPYFLIPALPVVAIYYLLQMFFRKTFRQLQRLDGITKQPILASFTETLSGLTTIRAYRDEVRFHQLMLQRIDANNTVYLWQTAINCWLGVRMDHLGAAVVFFSAMTSITAGVYGYIDSGMVGLAIAYALMISSYLNWAVRWITEMETQMSSVDRVMQYSNVIPEQYHTPNDVNVSADWPKLGKVEFRNVALRYDSILDPVIQDINFVIQPGQKVGICGPTGSGKTSMTLGLFRLVDICEGQILVDDTDITKVSLETLRSHLAIIPQDPTLFAGSIRYNLDPESQRSDEELWQALEVAQMKNVVQTMGQGLDAVISEGGENFSVGQRQLFCLARAFLRKSRVLVMDEVTTSVDLETEALIQNVIHTAFQHQTVISVTHRVTSITHFDMVIVVENGKVLETGEPQALLQKGDSKFATLVHGPK